MMRFVEPTALYFSDFGLDVDISGIACRGVFDCAYADAFGIVAGSSPVLLIDSSVPASAGDDVIVGDKKYVVTGIEPDGTGITRLRLDTA